MRALAITSMLLLASCCTYISKEDAKKLAIQELNHRKITFPQNCVIRVVEDTFVGESGPEVPIYVVSFDVPKRRAGLPLFDVELNRCTGEIRSFGDFRNSRVVR
jgi:hypothetical protein